MNRQVWRRPRALVALAGLLPLIAFISVLIGQIRHQQHSAMEAQLANRTTAAASALEVFLSNQRGHLSAIAASGSLDTDDLAAFRRAMQRLFASQPDWHTLILSDQTQQIINVRLPASAHAAPPVERESFNSAWATGKPQVSNFGEHGIAIRHPVIRDGAVRYVLSAVVKLDALNMTLAKEHLPDQWKAQLYDGNQRVLARSVEPERRIGMVASPALLRTIGGGGRAIRLTTREGIDSFTAAVPVRGTQWHVAVAAPVAVVAAPYRPIMLTLFAGGAIALIATIAVLVMVALDSRRRREMLEARVETAESASQEKSAFLASMSHEMRTPLNAVIGFAEVMDNRLFGPLGHGKYAEYIRDILTSGRHLLSLINDLLDLSKIEAGKMELHRAQIALGDTVQASVALVREAAAAKGIEIDVALPPDITVYADERLLRQMLVNLLSNAVKYTPGGTVRVRAAQQRDIRIVISDTGIGMAADEVRCALEPYVRIDSGIAREQGGTGLGLALTKRLAELHGGTLRLDSSPGTGTTATIALPPRGAHILTLARAA